ASEDREPTITELKVIDTYWSDHCRHTTFETVLATLIRNYFASEDREPTITELKVIDTYWSDHCRHTTFETVL
ncbi:hypothetical protein HT105_25375, partial [Bacteroides fragilis]|nr:hypothetical protein [Bacteroides fragilis]